jgi:dye decolorizing peroxidase
VAGEISRRALLTGVGGLVVGGAVGATAATAVAADSGGATDASTVPASVPFRGAHQAGIATPAQARVELVALDVPQGTTPAAVAALMQQWTTAAEAMTSGDGEPADPSREIIASGPARLTVTVGFGPAFFDTLGLVDQRPEGLADIPAFTHDQLDPRWVGGDVLLQVGADDALVAAHAARRLVTAAAGTLTTRWWQRGFSRTPRSTDDTTTPRNLMGQVDGTANPQPGTDLFDDTVWAGEGVPPWLVGGSFVAVRRIRMFLDAWDELTLDQQERVIGRDKAVGAPLTGTAETDTPDMGAQNDNGSLVIPADAHIRLARPEAAQGARMFRRGFSYDDGTAPDGTADAGLLFLAWQADPRKGFLPVQARVTMGDRLNAFTAAVGSALFACPGGVGEGEYLAQRLFTG